MKIRIATRTSKLAMAQTHFVEQELKKDIPGCEVEVLTFKTSGDRFLDKGLHEFEGKGAFTKEIEDALLQNQADIAVHSLKDLPTSLPKGLSCIAYLPRETPFDCLVSEKWADFDSLPRGARLGTGSVRRVTQIQALRPDIETVAIRGNVQTRLRKLTEQGLDGIILAVAGLKRLGLAGRITQELRPPVFVPAAAQGIIAVEARDNWNGADAVKTALNDHDTEFIAAIERGLLDVLGGGCHAPVGVYASFENKGIHVWAVARLAGHDSLSRADKVFDSGTDKNAIVREMEEKLRK